MWKVQTKQLSATKKIPCLLELKNIQ